MKTLSIAIFIVLIYIDFNVLNAQTLTQTQITAIEEAITEEMKVAGIPGVALAIINDNQVVYEKSFGHANSQTKIEMTGSTIFQIASVSKTFTALTILKELKDRNIGVHEPIGSVIKDLSPVLSSVTFHQLLTHKGGLIEYTNESDRTDIYEFFRNIGDSIMFIEPGKVFSYSNMGYALLDLSIEILTGMTYIDAVNRAVIKPLKLKNTSFDLYEIASKPFSSGHMWLDGKLTPKINHFEVPLLKAAGGLFSNLQDLERLALCLMNDGMSDGVQVFDPTLIEQICQPYSKDFMASGSSHIVQANWPNNAYGYGIWMFNYGKHRFVVSAGGGNHLTYFIYAPEARFSLIIHSNLAWQGLLDSFIKIFEVVLEQKNPSSNDFKANKEEWKEITGKYYLPAIRKNQFRSIFISEKNEKLYINFNSTGDIELEQIGNMIYRYSSPHIRYPMAISFQRDESNKVAYLLNVWRAYLKNE